MGIETIGDGFVKRSANEARESLRNRPVLKTGGDGFGSQAGCNPPSMGDWPVAKGGMIYKMLTSVERKRERTAKGEG